MEFWVELREWNETVLLPEGGKGLEARGEMPFAVEGGARPLPLPSTLPPPSLRPDILISAKRHPSVSHGY